MKIQLDSFVNYFPSNFSLSTSRMKPIIAMISALAIGILLYQVFNFLKDENSSSPKISPKEKDPKVTKAADLSFEKSKASKKVEELSDELDFETYLRKDALTKKTKPAENLDKLEVDLVVPSTDVKESSDSASEQEVLSEDSSDSIEEIDLSSFSPSDQDCIRSALKSYFADWKSWEKMTDDEILNLDFSKQDPKLFKNMCKNNWGFTDEIPPHLAGYKHRLNGLLLDYMGKKGDRIKGLIQKMDRDQLNYISPYFTNKHWGILSYQQIVNWDFSTIDQKLFDKFSIDPFRFKEVIKIIEKDQKRLDQITPYFSNSDWRQLSDDYILNMDFSKITSNIFKALFPQDSDRTKALLQKIKVEDLEKIIPYFSDWHSRQLITDDLKMDFSKINQDIFNILFNSKTKDLLQKIKIDELEKIIPYFKLYHWRALSDDQILARGFDKMDSSTFSVLFEPCNDRVKGLLKKIKVDDLEKIIPYFKHYHLLALSDDQKRALEAKKITKTSSFEDDSTGSTSTSSSEDDSTGSTSTSSSD